MKLALPTKALVSKTPARSVGQLSGQLLELRWERTVLQLRAVDLLVLRQELDCLSQASGWLRDETYTLCLQMGEHRHAFFFTRYDLDAFYTMVCEAASHLPERPIHWRDLRVSLHNGAHPTKLFFSSIN